MFDGVFDVFAEALSFFYDLVPNYAIAIALLTLLVMVVTTPFTLKGTRSMIQMQRLQPEMRKLQIKYKDDRQKLNEELMAFYKENKLNPLGGCLPLLLQTPDLHHPLQRHPGPHPDRAGRHLRPEVPRPHLATLYQDLDPARRDDGSFGVDLAESASKALRRGLRRTASPTWCSWSIVALTLLLPAEADPGPQPQRRDAAAAEDAHAALPGHVRGGRLRVARRPSSCTS